MTDPSKTRQPGLCKPEFLSSALDILERWKQGLLGSFETGLVAKLLIFLLESSSHHNHVFSWEYEYDSPYMIGICGDLRKILSSLGVTVQLTGLHARSESLIDLTREYDRNRVPWSKVKEAIHVETGELIKFQEKLGCQPLSDGALDWKDQLRPITQCIAGLAEATRYSRWYDTNTFYQKPIVTGRLDLNNFQLEHFFEPELFQDRKNWSVALPGPWTLAELSENKYYPSQTRLLDDYVRVLREIIAHLARKSVNHIQLSEPSLVYWPYRDTAPSRTELERGVDSIRTLVEKTPVRITIHTFFGDANPILPLLLGLPVDNIGIDLYETDWQKLPRVPSEIGLVLGIVDSEESLVEEHEWIAKTAHAIQKKLALRRVVIAPNTDLKFVPREKADQKLASLSKAASILNTQGET